jgi:endoribonuclease LACTB2
MISLRKLNDIQQAEIMVSLAGQKLFVSIYLIDGILFDTGPSRMKREIIPLLREWRFEQIILTHHHEDHTGLAPWIEANLNVPLFIHKLGISKCHKKEPLPLYRRLFWGERSPFKPNDIGSIVEGKRYTWEVVHTPGHADDHVALYNREKGILMGGDLYVLMRPKSMFEFESVPTIIDSLKKLLSYDFDTYVCSHAGILKDGRKKIEQKLKYLEEIQGGILEYHSKGFSKREIRKILLPKKHPLNYLSLFENSPMHIINSVINHAE